MIYNTINEDDLYIDGITKTSGMEILELQHICGLVKAKKPMTILEIGTMFGRTSINMARVAPEECKLLCVDIKHQDHSGLQKYPELKKITFITANSLASDFKFKGYSQYDFILVDGNHKARWVENDTRKALSVLAPNGVIVWHDYGKSAKYVSIQVKETLTKMRIYPRHILGTSLAYMENKG